MTKTWLLRACHVLGMIDNSWLNMVERFFRDLSTQRWERGVVRSVPELIAAIKQYVAVHNKNPKPFIWAARLPTCSRKSSAPISA